MGRCRACSPPATPRSQRRVISTSRRCCTRRSSSSQVRRSHVPFKLWVIPVGDLRRRTDRLHLGRARTLDGHERLHPRVGGPAHPPMGAPDASDTLLRRFDRQTPDVARYASSYADSGGGSHVRTEGRFRHLSGGRRGLLQVERAAATRRHVVPLGPRRGRRHLGRVLRLELRPGHRRVRRSADRRRAHGGHVLRPRLLDRRDVPGAPAHGRRLLVRPVGDGPLGWVPHRFGREHGVRHHAGGGRRRDGPADATDRRRTVQRRRALRSGRSRRRRDVVEQPPVLVGRVLHHLRRDQYHRDRDHDAVHRDDHGAVDRRPALLLPGGDLLREARLLPLDEHLEGRNADPGWRGFVVALRDQRDLQVPAVRDLVLPRDRGGSARGRGVDGPPARRPERLDPGACTRC